MKVFNKSNIIINILNIQKGIFYTFSNNYFEEYTQFDYY